MGNFGMLLGLLISFLFTLAVRWLFPHVWATEAGGIFPVPQAIKIAAWTLFLGFPLGCILGARERRGKLYGIIFSVLLWYPLMALLLFGHHALPPFFMRGHSDALRWLTAMVGLGGGGWIVLWIYENIIKGGGWEGGSEWLAHFLDRIFGRK